MLMTIVIVIVVVITTAVAGELPLAGFATERSGKCAENHRQSRAASSDRAAFRSFLAGIARLGFHCSWIRGLRLGGRLIR